jgi:Fic family protein
MTIPYDRNEPFNALPLLPPDAAVLRDPEVLLKWGRASRVLGQLNGNVQRLPNPTMLVNTISLQEAKSSSAIENIFTTDDELYKATADTVREESASPAIKEVLRYRQALWTGHRRLGESRLLDEEAIVQVYQQIKDTSQGIRPPQSRVSIKRGNSDLRPGEVIYTPPRGAGILEEKLDNLVAFLNDHQAFDLDPLLKMVVGHYQFEAIHPFTDGNGRTGRVLNLLYLVNEGLLSHPVLYLSKYIIDHKMEYYHALQTVTTQRDWKRWILYMLTAVERTAIYTNQLIADIIDQMNATLEYGKSKLEWYNKEVNEVLFSQPYLKPNVLGEALGKFSAPTLRKYIKDLQAIGIVSQKQDWKDVFYINDDLVRILAGD